MKAYTHDELYGSSITGEETAGHTGRVTDPTPDDRPTGDELLDRLQDAAPRLRPKLTAGHAHYMFDGPIPWTHHWQRDRFSVHIGQDAVKLPGASVTWTLDRAALDTLIAHLQEIRAEWDSVA